MEICTMQFSDFVEMIQRQFAKMVDELREPQDCLYEVDVDKEELWQVYLNAYPGYANPFFRARRFYDCTTCKKFIQQVGAVVTIKNGVMHTIWECYKNSRISYEFYTVAKEVDDFLRHNVRIKRIYNCPYGRKIGVPQNVEKRDDGSAAVWTHFYLEIPKRFDQPENDVGSLGAAISATGSRLC